jgi:hypothetical protein
MKKKPEPLDVPVVPAELREMAKLSVETDKVRPNKVCAVCQSAYLPSSGPAPSENLCWVCRRLKISAWRDNDQQVAVQE